MYIQWKVQKKQCKSQIACHCRSAVRAAKSLISVYHSHRGFAIRLFVYFRFLLLFISSKIAILQIPVYRSVMHRTQRLPCVRGGFGLCVDWNGSINWNLIIFNFPFSNNKKTPVVAHRSLFYWVLQVNTCRGISRGSSSRSQCRRPG